MNITVKENKVTITPGYKRVAITTVGIQGPQGPESFHIRGQYINGTSYNKRDLVYYQGNTYYANQDTIATPGVAVTAWTVMSIGNRADLIATNNPAKSVQDRLNELDGKMNVASAAAQDGLSIFKNSTTKAATLYFPAAGVGNDPAYIQHIENPVDTSELRISVGDNSFLSPSISDSLVIGSSPAGIWQGAYKFRDKLYFADLTTGVFDTNLYRYDTNILKTDGQLFTGGKLTVGGKLIVNDFDFVLGAGDQVSRGNTGESRAMVKIPGGVLNINYANDFAGGVYINGTVSVPDGFTANTATINNTLTANVVNINGQVTNSLIPILGTPTSNPLMGPNRFNSTATGLVLFPDLTFNKGLNGFQLYNNSANSAVTITRGLATSFGQVTGNKSGYIVKISYNAANGIPSPGLGGYYQSTLTRANAMFVHRIRAKIPVGYTINFASNLLGTNPATQWNTPTAGTGKWEDYVYTVVSGNTGSFADFGFVFISGDSSVNVDWYVASSSTYDMTTTGISELIANGGSLYGDMTLSGNNTSTGSHIFNGPVTFAGGVTNTGVSTVKSLIVNNTDTALYTLASLQLTVPAIKTSDKDFRIFLQKNTAATDGTSTGTVVFRQNKDPNDFTNFTDHIAINFSTGVTTMPNLSATKLAISSMNGDINMGPTDNQGITFFGGGRIWKKAGTGLQIKNHDDSAPITFRNSTDAFDTLAISSTSTTNYQGLTYLGKKVFNEGFMGSGSGLSADTFQGNALTDFVRLSNPTGGTISGSYYNASPLATSWGFDFLRIYHGMQIGQYSGSGEGLRLVPGYLNAPTINFTQNGSDFTVNHTQLGYKDGDTTFHVKNSIGKIVLDTTAATAASTNSIQLLGAKDILIKTFDDSVGLIKLLNSTQANGFNIKPVINSIDSIGTTMYLNAISGGTGTKVSIGQNSSNSCTFNVTGTSNTTGLAFVHSSSNTQGGVAPTISLAIGDNDTGFNWVQDGKVNFVANGAVVGYWNSAGVTTSSSRTLKENITPYYDHALDTINKVEVVNYNFKADVDKTPKVGFIAEDTDTLLAGPDHDGMDISNTLGLLIKSVQELSDQVDYLSNKIKEME